MTGTEVRALRDEEIGIELKRLREKLFALRSQAVTEKVENTAQFGLIKKDVARLMTERNVRHHAKLAAEKAKKAGARPAPAAKAEVATGTKAGAKSRAKAGAKA